MISNLDLLQKELNYYFKNVSILQQALTHISYSNENNCLSYDRLEFLGDAIIEYVVSDFIYKNINLDSHKATDLRKSLVSADNLELISKKLCLDKLALRGKCLNKLGKKNTSDLFESLVASIYLDGGIDCAINIINKYLIVSVDNIKSHMDYYDPKTKLQELLQKEAIDFEYRVLSEVGKDHEKVFEVGLFILNNLVCKNKSFTIKDAEEKCAEEYLKIKR